GRAAGRASELRARSGSGERAMPRSPAESATCGSKEPCRMFVTCYARQTMYTIKQAAQRTGIAIPTIRVWERRYGVVAPKRTPSGYRLYDDEAIARLNAMQRLVEHEG